MKRLLPCLLPALLAASAALADEAKVKMNNSLFTPETITVRAGDRVVWINDDEDGHHRVDFADPAIGSSGDLKPGKEFAVVFKKPGEYVYACRYHKDYGMKGKVVVTEAGK